MTLFAGLDGAHFAYHGYDPKAPWDHRWAGQPLGPRLLRLEFARAGLGKEIVMEWPLLISDAAPEPPRQ